MAHYLEMYMYMYINRYSQGACPHLDISSISNNCLNCNTIQGIK